jgi:3-methyladenine DNA glycosylase AlkD
VLSTAADIQRELRAVADPADAVALARFFKSGAGQYGEGDEFIGVRVPATRAVVRRHRDLPLAQVDLLLDSPVHEDRLAGLLVLGEQFRAAGLGRADRAEVRSSLHSFYLRAVHRGRVNNWDLVDASAEHLVGTHLCDRAPVDGRRAGTGDLPLLRELAASDSLWERRIAIVSTYAFIKAGEAAATFEIAELLLDDREDLIHKAVGWMLREVGKRVSQAALLSFLERNAGRLPRTALTYATEHLSPDQRAAFRAIPRSARQDTPSVERSR